MKKLNYESIYTSDFETIEREGRMEVWLADVCRMSDFKHETFLDIESWFDWVCKHPGTYYFHNLKFDGTYILTYLLEQGWKHVYEEKDLQPRTFNTLISDMGSWYWVKIKPEEDVVISIFDSYKKIASSVKNIAKAYKLSVSKGDIEYNKPREKGYIPDANELSYVQRDTQIPCEALKQQFESGMVKLTSASDAEYEFGKILKETCSLDYKKYLHYDLYDGFPFIDKFVRKSYCGGISWVNPEIKEQVVYEGAVYDYNSMYPSVMLAYPVPISIPEVLKEIPEDEKILWIAELYMHCTRKEGFPACLRNPEKQEWVEDDFQGNITITSVDYEIIKKCYNIHYMEFVQGYSYGYGERGVFDEYVLKFAKEKKANKEKGGFAYQKPKLYLNSLYGKFGTNPDKASKIPYLDDKGVLSFYQSSGKVEGARNVAVASFITAYARRELINGILDSEGLFCYCDTDSIHIASKDGKPPVFHGRVDSVELGCWDCEGYWKRAKFLRAKTYVEETYIFKEEKYIRKSDGIKMKLKRICTDAQGNKIHELDENGEPKTYLNVKACGCTEESKKYVTFDNFKMGSTYPGKKVPVLMRGGTKIVERNFTVRKPFSC